MTDEYFITTVLRRRGTAPSEAIVLTNDPNPAAAARAIRWDHGSPEIPLSEALTAFFDGSYSLIVGMAGIPNSVKDRIPMIAQEAFMAGRRSGRRRLGGAREWIGPRALQRGLHRGMKMPDYDKVYSQDNPEGDAHGWIQWKGTDVCMDLHCRCGAHGHIDGEFFYYYKCESCGRVYAVGQIVKLIELDATDSAEVLAEGGCLLSDESLKDGEPPSQDSSK